MTGARSIIGLLGWLAATFAGAWIGSRFMPGEWYRALAKPTWTPPSAVFAPVWTALYALMAVAAWLVWRRAGFAGARAPLSMFIIQLALNTLWSALFFGAHRIGLAFVEILVLWAAILLVTVLFWREQRLAGMAMLPYLAWVSFASCLNGALWWMNRGPAV